MPKQDVAVELFYDGTWHDITANDDVFTVPIVIKRGQSDEATQLRPASIAMQLANDDDMYRTSNPESPLYGKAGLNTSTRVSVAGVVRGTVEASAWKAGQTREFRRIPRRGKAWVDLEGGGALQRAGQWTEPLKSSFRQYNDTIPGAAGYWPAEQPRGSTSLISTIPGTSQAGSFFGWSFDSQTRPPGSAPLMDVGENAELGEYFAAEVGPGSITGWQLSWAARYEPLTTEQFIMNWEATDLTAYSMTLNPADGKLYMYSSKNGVAVLNVGQSYGSYDWSQWTLFSLDARWSAGTLSTNIFINWTNGDNTQSGFLGVGFSDVPAGLRWWSITGISGDVPAGSTVGHTMGVNVDSTGGVDLFSAARIAAWTGHLGETAADRLARLCTLKNLAYTIVGVSADSYPMGPQQVDTFAGQLKEIATTEDGLIFDDIDAIGLVFLLRNERYNQTPACAFELTDLPQPPDEVTDDLDPHNIVTASQREGGDYTTSDDTGPLGTQAPPDGVGEYRQTVDVNVSDEAGDLPQVANWWLRRGTVNLPRFPQVAVNLAALDAATIAEVEAVDVGSVITINGYREYTIRLYVLGYTETIGTHSRSIVFTCAPDQQFAVGAYDTARYDSGSTVTHASYAIGVNTIVFRTEDYGDLWSTTSTYDCVCSGERFTVTTMGPDGTFEATGLPGWNSATDGTWARSTAQAHTGTGSGLLTVVGTPTQTYVRQPAIPVTVGVSYRIVMWAFSVAGVSNILAVIDWLDINGGYLSSTSQSLTLSAGIWTPFDVTGVAPASTAYAQYGPTIGSSPAAGTAIYVDDIHFQQASGSTGWVQTATVTRAVNGIVKALPSGEPIHVVTPGRYAL